MDINTEASPQPCQEDGHNPNHCEARGHQPQPCQEGPRPARLAACGGLAGPTPAPIAEATDEAKEARRYDLAKLRAALRKSHEDDSAHQSVAAPPVAKRPSSRDRYRAAVEEVEQIGIYNRTAQMTEMSLGKVARHLQRHSGDLPTGWAVSDLHAAFGSGEFFGANRLSWGWIISEPVWPRFAEAVGKAFESRKVREADRAESFAKAEEAAASDDPTLRARAGAFFAGVGAKRPQEGVPLLLEALDHAESAAFAARLLGEWSASPDGGEALVALAVGKLRGFLEGREADGSDAAEDARWALRALERRLVFPPVGPAYDEFGVEILREPSVADLMMELVGD